MMVTTVVLMNSCFIYDLLAITTKKTAAAREVPYWYRNQKTGLGGHLSDSGVFWGLSDPPVVQN